MEYSGTSEEGHRIANKVAIGWLGNERIHDPLWKITLQNVAEFYCVEAEIHGYKHQFYDNDPAELCRKANEAGCSHILIMKIGLFPQQLLDKFTEWFENYYNGEVFTGHVLDKGNLYYEIHPQCMFIDVKWFCDNLTEFAQRFRNRQIDFIEPIRSTDNFHDHYTPHWVKQGTETKTYEGTCWGWNVVSEGLKAPTGIGIWPMKMRDTYTYAYAEVQQDYIGKKARILGHLQNKEQFFIANTEDFKLPEQIPNPDPNVQRIIFCTAGGLSAPFLSYNYFGQVTENQKVIVIDRSGIALGLSNHIFENFDPNVTTYKNYMTEYFSKFMWMRKLVQGVHRLDAMSDYVNYHDSFKKYFVNEWKDVDKEFKVIDLFDVDHIKKLFRNYVIDPAEDLPERKFEVYVNLSNVFHFYQSSVFFSIKERVQIKESIESFFNEINSKYDNIELQLIGPGGRFKYNGYIPFSMEGAQVAKDIFPWM